MKIEDIKKIEKKIKRTVVEMISRTKTAHIGGNFSEAEILAALYFKVLNIDPARPDDPDRDRFILSKGHAVATLYATLAEKGFMREEDLAMFYANGGLLPGHVSKGAMPGIEASMGSLGHGLPVGVGMALAGKKDKKNYRTFVLMSDGECDEGSNWEAILFAGHHKLDNLIAIVDYNKWQSFGSTKEVLDLEPFAEKWRDFNWAVREVDGHDLGAVIDALEKVPFELSRPSVLIAHTVKGKGLLGLENKLESHYKPPTPEEAEKIIESIERS